MKKTLHITIVLLFSFVTLFAQTKKADAYFNNLAYVKAAASYEKLAKNTPTQEILQKLGDSYYFNVNMEKAAAVYQKLVTNFSKKLDAEYLFRYAQSLRGIGNYESSDAWMKKFHQATKEDDRGVHFLNSKITTKDLRSKPNYSITNLSSINTPFSDFGVTQYNEQLLYASTKKVNRFIKRKHAWNERSFLDIYAMHKDSVLSPTVKRENFSKNINLKYHESSVAFSPDKKTIYFTRNNYNNGVYREDKKGTNNLKIYTAKWIDGAWRNSKELPFCSNQYSVGHPTVTKDGKTMYFTSDMPGTYGKTDIFRIAIKEDGSFGMIEWLGPEINTKGREMFPFIADDNTLYFSSDGHFGLGALDVFSSKLTSKGFEHPKNLKAPINSELDDFAFTINPTTKKGYLSSNRKGGKGDDDIYSVTQLKEEMIIPPCFTQKEGVVVDSKTQQILPGSKVILTKNNIKLDSILVGADARFSFKVSCDSTYVVKGAKQYYQPSVKTFIAVKVREKESITLALDLESDFMHCGNGDICIKINPIYFDTNKSKIRLDASVELDRVIAIMNKYPQITIQSGSHTDARGRAVYNERLSERRANSTVAYILSKGINSSRITGKGFGETRLTNNCVDNDRHSNSVKCSKEEHQANRRTEFVIVKMK